eukprot:697886-Rhodomonas_salina.1
MQSFIRAALNALRFLHGKLHNSVLNRPSRSRIRSVHPTIEPTSLQKYWYPNPSPPGSVGSCPPVPASGPATLAACSVPAASAVSERKTPPRHASPSASRTDHPRSRSCKTIKTKFGMQQGSGRQNQLGHVSEVHAVQASAYHDRRGDGCHER